MTEMPWDKFKGGLWDANGVGVLRTQRPPDVTDLPPLAVEPGENLPDGISLRLLEGNWYGSGPEIVVLHEAEMVHYSFPLWARKQLWRYVKVVQEAVRLKRAGVPTIKRGGIEGWNIPGSIASGSSVTDRLAKTRQPRKGASP